jgi:hypothetical protein
VLALLLALVLLLAARTSDNRDVSEAATINTVTTASIILSIGFLPDSQMMNQAAAKTTGL